MTPDIHITINPFNKKWCVAVLVGSCETVEEAKKLAEEVGPLIGNVLLGKK